MQNNKNYFNFSYFRMFTRPLIQNQGDFQWPHLQEYFHHNYHLLFKYQNPIFSASHTTESELFSTSYPITGNEFGHTGLASVLPKSLGADKPGGC